MADVQSNNSKSQQEEVVDLSFVAAIFDNVKVAKEAYAEMKEANREGLLTIEAAAYLEKTDRSKLKVHEFNDWSGGRGALTGAAAGSVIGLIGGAILLPAAVGALVVGIWSRVHDTGFDNKELAKVGAEMPAGSSALIALVRDTNVAAVELEFQGVDATKVTSGPIPRSTYEAMPEATK